MKKSIYLALVGVLSISIMSGCGSDKDEITTIQPYQSQTEEVSSEAADKSEAQTVEESKSEAPAVESSVEEGTSDGITEEQALKAIVKYCYEQNPTLEDIVNAGEYSTYWDISSIDDEKFLVIYRSYTGAQNRYYIDKNTGETTVAEFVPGIMDEEEPTDEKFNVKDYFEE